jgi:serine/threonine-protein kinase
MTSPAADIPGVPRPGEVLAGKYRVERILGAGGMGVVLAAWHVVLERRVAVKFLLPAAAALPEAGARFLREAKAAAALEGEHVARVLDVGTLETGAPYMVLEYLSGDDLGAVLKARGPLPVGEAVDLFLQVVEAMAEAHARGIVHRDLKPKNIFLTRRPDGAPLAKVLDFGLSKILHAGEGPKDASLTATDLIIGSVHYMSPEQIRSLKYADARTDIWALGVIFYEMLAGRRPFTGESFPAVTAAVIADAPATLAAFRPDIPGAIDALVGRCLEKDPARRVQTVTELARGLAPFGSARAALSFESIARVLPERVAAPPSPRGSFPSFGGVDAVAPAPVPVPRAALPSSSGAAAPQALTSWGHTRRIIASRNIAVVMAGAGVTIAGVAAVAWVLFVRTPADGPASALEAPAAAESTNPEPSSTAIEPAESVEQPASAAPVASVAETIATTTPVGSVSTPPPVTAAPAPAPGKPGPSIAQTAAQKPPPASTTPAKKKSQDIMGKWD